MTARSRTGSTTNDGGKERRRHHRVPTRVPLDADVQGQRFQIETSNLSAGGAYCHSDRRFPAMARLEVSVDLPSLGGGGPLRFAAVVVRCVKDGTQAGGWNLALFFPDLDSKARVRLAHFVQSQQARILETDPGPHRRDS